VSRIRSPGFRDPGGRVLIADNQVFRAVSPHAFATVQLFLETRAAKTLLENGELVRTQVVESGKLFGHERVPFISYPYEWPAEMLYSAAMLTLKIADTIAPENWRLKDATPYNVLFAGPKPIFVDMLSFEHRPSGDMIWPAYGQFLRTFLLPLLAQRSFGFAVRDVLLTRRDGLQPEDLYRLCGTLRKLQPSILSLVSIPTWLGRGSLSRRPASATDTDPEKARFVFKALLRRMTRKLKSVSPIETKSVWSDYSSSTQEAAYYEAKRSFVREAFERYRPKTGLDVGCNTGDFSCLAAETGVSMVALDSDPAVVGTTWRRAIKYDLNILPLVIDITRPSPDCGWFNGECESFLSRAHHRFDIVLLLAVMHHIAKDGIPLEEFIRMAEHLTADLAIVELVEHNDPGFADMVRGREQIFESYNLETFERQSSKHFEIVSRAQVRPARWLYLLRKAK
jgi:SAM-dependent methyltransferase